MKSARTPLIGVVAGLAIVSLAGGASGATVEAYSAPAVPPTAGAVQIAQQIAIPTGEKRAKSYKRKKVADRSGTNDGTVGGGAGGGGGGSGGGSGGGGGGGGW